MNSDVIVLGAGMVGISTAIHLQRQGKSVVVIDRKAPGEETSYGNAGVIQREAVRPYAFPRDWPTLFSAIGNQRLDIRYRPLSVLQSMGPLLQYYRHSAPARYQKIAREYASIIALSLDSHGDLIEAAGADGLLGEQGLVFLYRTAQARDEAFATAEAVRAEGVSHRKLTGKELAQLEPTLADSHAGGIHWTDPWTIRSPGDLVKAYAALFEQLGGRILRGDAATLRRQGQHWHIRDEQLDDHLATDVVVCLGPWSTRLTSRFGYAPPLFVKRGYHMHYRYRESRPQQTHWVLDAERGYLMAPMKQGIRLTTGAELALLDEPASYAQLEAAEAVARQTFAIGERVDPQPWKGARPCMPDMKPVIGAVPGAEGMWCAFGHGHQGFTLGPATGMLLAAMMSGEPAAIDMNPFAPARSF